jgi:membrane protein YqaA with SNARE-associated domain
VRADVHGGGEFWVGDGDSGTLNFTCSKFQQPKLHVIMRGMQTWLDSLLHLLALPEYGLVTLFLVAFISATLLPLGSEPALLGLLQLNPHLFWPAIFVATAGNTLGGAVDWWMGYGARKAIDATLKPRTHQIASRWLQGLGPAACLLAWLPIVGDPLCVVAGWLRLPFWPCVLYMAVGKFARYVVMTMAFQAVF